VNVRQAPLATFTEWVKNNAASHGLYLRDECELRDPHEDGGIIQCKRQDLASEEVQNHLAAGKLVTKLSLAWEDKLSFVLDDKLVIKRLRFEDLLQEQAEQDGGDDSDGQFDASFTLMMLTLTEFLPQLFEALGGEEIAQAVYASCPARRVSRPCPSSGAVPRPVRMPGHPSGVDRRRADRLPSSRKGTRGPCEHPTAASRNHPCVHLLPSAASPATPSP